MSLFDRYLAEVGQRLPRERREDILSELRTLLADAFEARGGDQNSSAPDEDLAAEILVEFGPPGQIATAYLPGKRYLIGPRYFSSFVSTMQICFWVMLAIVGTGLLFDLFDGFDSLWALARTIGASFNDLVSSLLSLLGMVVLIFALIERATPGAENRPLTVWDPRTLPLPKDTRRIDVPGTMVGMALAVVALVVLNMIPDKVCFHFDLGAGNYTVPMLGPTFVSQLPWLNGYLLLGLGLGVLTIRHGRWERGLRLADLLIHLLLVIFFYQLATGAMVVELGADWLVSHGVPADHATDLAEEVGPILATILRIAFWVALVAAVFSGLFKLKAFLTGDRSVHPDTAS